jgi:hypothetical protein
MGDGAFLGRASRRVVASVAVIGSFGSRGACGQRDEPTSIASVKQCLEDEGLEVRAAIPGPDDDDAPDRGELVTSGAFVAFYSSSDRAEQLAPEVRENADQARGEVARFDDRRPLAECEAGDDRGPRRGLSKLRAACQQRGAGGSLS